MENISATVNEVSENTIRLFSLFDSLDIKYTNIEHPPLFTVAESKGIACKIPGAHTKNLFLKDDHKNFWLISALQETSINLRWLSKNLSSTVIAVESNLLIYMEKSKVTCGGVFIF